jgi:catechol 2,3-dioxygenase-like lactoylglutathione lyase family enzyme
MSLDHVSIQAGDYRRSIAFYEKALAPLGIKGMLNFGGDGWHTIGFGDTRPFFWIGTGTALSGKLHVAFTAKSREEVDAFYAAALAAGGRDNGPPGLRPHYHANYYGAFVLDPDGHNIEAVYHGG